MTVALILVLFVAIGILGFLLWKTSKDKSDYQVGLSSDIAQLKSQLQSLGGAVGDVGAIKSQVESLASTVTQIGGIKSQVEALGGAIQDVGAIKSQIEALSSTSAQVGGIKSQVESMGVALQDLGAIKSQVEALSTSAQALSGIKSGLEALQVQESQLNDSVQAIANKLIGSREVGAAGENLLAEAFESFPPGWIERDFRVGGKIVEFALRLPNQRRLPIDSKWPAIELLSLLGDEADPEKRIALVSKVEDAVAAKAREAAKYIDPSQTIHLAIAAIPDSAYSVCRKAHYEAIRAHVLVVSYSMALPIVLALYRFQLEYATSVDQGHLDAHLSQIADCLTAIEQDLENRVNRGSTMISNAFSECMTKIGKIRASLSALRSPAVAAQELPAPDERAPDRPAE
ncbi:MAG: DNA recombination protein RmuC [Acidobacteria bacterium]|nr:DNA recombination protein RmuC [Acidobacteriota bacterium]